MNVIEYNSWFMVSRKSIITLWAVSSNLHLTQQMQGVDAGHCRGTLLVNTSDVLADMLYLLEPHLNHKCSILKNVALSSFWSFSQNRDAGEHCATEKISSQKGRGGPIETLLDGLRWWHGGYIVSKICPEHQEPKDMDVSAI